MFTIRPFSISIVTISDITTLIFLDDKETLSQEVEKPRFNPFKAMAAQPSFLDAIKARRIE